MASNSAAAAALAAVLAAASPAALGPALASPSIQLPLELPKAHASGPPAARQPLDPKERAAVPLVNPGFEGRIASTGQPEGWMTIQHAGKVSYTFTPDHDEPRSGERSLRVDNVGSEPYGAVYQTIDAAPYRGRTLVFSAWMKTKDTRGNRFGKGAGLKLHAMKNGYPSAVKQMRRDAIDGTTGWTRYQLELAVPPDATQVEVGLNLFGPGTAWLDDVALEVLPAKS
jgi:hypothetical protein